MLVDVAPQFRAVGDRCRDLLDRFGRRIEHRDSLPLEKVLAFAHLVTAVLDRSILAARTALLANLVQPLRIDREAEQPVLVREDRPRERAVDEIVGRERKVRGAYAELQSEIQRGRRLGNRRAAIGA